jgi:hypothetical protein
MCHEAEYPEGWLERYGSYAVSMLKLKRIEMEMEMLTLNLPGASEFHQILSASRDKWVTWLELKCDPGTSQWYRPG